jgi:PKD domain
MRTGASLSRLLQGTATLVILAATGLLLVPPPVVRLGATAVTCCSILGQPIAPESFSPTLHLQVYRGIPQSHVSSAPSPAIGEFVIPHGERLRVSGDSLQSGPGLSVSAAFDPGVGAVPLPVRFFVQATGGVPPYNFTWHFGDSATYISTLTGNTSHTYTLAGSYLPRLWVNDSGGASVNSSGPITVEAQQLRVGSPFSSPSSVDLGQSGRFSVNVTGGSGVYNYTWYGLPNGCGSINASFLSCTPLQAGSSNLSVLVIDSVNLRVLGNVTQFWTFAPPSIASVRASLTQLDVGQSSTLSIVATSNGSGVAKYAWSGLPTGCPPVNAAVVSCRPSSAGVYDVTASITDSDGVASSTASVKVFVSSMLLAGTLSPPSTSLDLNQSIVLSATPSGGRAPFSFVWTGLPLGCNTINLPTISCKPTRDGVYHPRLLVSDTNIASVETSNASITVAKDPRVDWQLTPSSPIAGARLYLNVTLLNGSAPFTISYRGLPNGCASANATFLTCSPTTAGSYSVIVQVVDHTGMAVNQTIAFDVSPGSHGTGDLTAIWTSPWVLGGVLASAAIMVGLVAAVRRGRMKRGV